MKRSRKLTLALMSATALTLAACDDPQDVAIFENADQCAKTDGFTLEQCEADLKQAQAEHVRVAPKYTSVADCEADFGAGQCETAPQQTTSGGSVFMPLMMGYMMGSMLGGNRAGVASQPLYRSADDSKSFRTGDNQKVGSKTGVTKVPGQIARAPTTKTSTVRRGGFGASAARFGGGARSFGG